MVGKRTPEAQNEPAQANVPSSVNRECFVITPIGEEASAERRRANGLYEAVLVPTLAELGYSVKAAHHIASVGSITEQVISHVLHCDLVVADLSGLNPNVMYELAVRHSTGRPMIVLADAATNLPFDVKQERTIFYRDDFSGVTALRTALIDAVKSISFNGDLCDNPVTRVSKAPVLDPSTEVAPADAVILERLELLTAQVAAISRQPRQPYEFRSWTSRVRNFGSGIAEATFVMNGESLDELERRLKSFDVTVLARKREEGGGVVRLALASADDRIRNGSELADLIDATLKGTKIRLESISGR